MRDRETTSEKVTEYNKEVYRQGQQVSERGAGVSIERSSV